MPRNMSFALTTEQFRNRTKTVTRRLGWDFLVPEDVVCGVEKGMGLKKGEKVVRLGLIEIIANDREPLGKIRDYPDDCAKEGFPELTPDEFIIFFIKHNKCNEDTLLNRIEFKYL